MDPTIQKFLSATDDKNFTYFYANPQLLESIIYGQFTRTVKKPYRFSGLLPPEVFPDSKDIASFLSDKMIVTPMATGIFSTDLTSRDDIILAVLSLLVIFGIESILAVLLLRHRDCNISTFGISVKHFLDLVRDFRVPYLMKRREHRRPMPREFSRKLILTVLILFLTMIGAEVAILVLSSSNFRNVTNDMASFQIIPVVNPHWPTVRDRANDPFDRPCRDIRFPNVRNLGRVTACLTSSSLKRNFDPFELVTSEVDMVIASYMHEFGVEHTLSIAGENASFSARGDYRLGTGLSRLMSQRVQYFDKGLQLSFIHMQYVAFLFNEYRMKREDSAMNLARLEAINFDIKEEPGPLIDVIQLNGASLGYFRRVRSMKHTTTIRAVLPRGEAALRFAQICFAASIGITLSGPDETSVQLGSGNTIPMPGVLWQEDARTLNWLSMLIIFFLTLLVLTFLRITLKPMGTADFAIAAVEEAVGSRRDVSPVFWDGEEMQYFSVASLIEQSLKLEEDGT